jgi:hypothetical protein
MTAPASAGSTSAPPPAPAQRAAANRLDWILVGWLTLLVMVSTVFTVFFLPLYVGTVPLPGSALAGGLIVFVGIRLCYRLTGSMTAALAPAVGWLVVAAYLSFSRTLGYPLVIGDWRSTLLLGGGALAAAMGVSLCWGTHALGAVDSPVAAAPAVSGRSTAAGAERASAGRTGPPRG